LQYDSADVGDLHFGIQTENDERGTPDRGAPLKDVTIRGADFDYSCQAREKRWEPLVSVRSNGM
jgi:hypothetical protein